MDMDPDCLPPPAYSEQDFDQKIAQATDLSLIASNSVDQQGWERYDPAAFGANPASTNVVNLPSPPPSKASFFDQSIPTNNSPSVLPTIVPLRIEKKSQLGRDPYYNYNSAVDRSGDRSPHPSVLQRSQSQERRNGYSGTGSYLQQEAMPPYSPAPVSQGRSSFASTTGPQSPWEDQVQHPLSGSYWPSPQRSSMQHPLPVAPNKHTVVQEQRRVHSSYSSDAPIVPFDPTIAYGKPSISSNSPNEAASPTSRVQYDPHSLYNSVVSAQMHPLRSSHGASHQLSPDEHLRNTTSSTPMRPVYPTHTFNNDPSSRLSQPLPANVPRHSVSWQTASRPASHYTTPHSHNSAAAADANRYSHYSNG